MAFDYRQKAGLLPLLFINALAFLCLCSSQKDSASPWKTLTGKAPVVVANGGLSGLFPDQTSPAYGVAINNSLDAVMFCDLQLTKDAQGICRTGLQLEKSTNIDRVFPKQNNSYLVNGNNTSGWFSIDFTSKELSKSVTAIQRYLPRSEAFDNLFPLLPPEEVYDSGPASTWLNVQYSIFFEEHNLSMPIYVRSLSRRMPLDYISSTEIGFLRDIAPTFRRSKTKLIFRFLDKGDIDPSINETYGSILRDLKFVKGFAAGVLVPKSYVWPTGTDGYLQAPTNLVNDAHIAGLEIFAADFANDINALSYNYSYDPIREYLQYVDNNYFAVDGFLTDFPGTASEAIACYAYNNGNISSRAGNPLIISHNGASGDYPGCTDIAYKAAIRDGADYIDCSVQITKDGIPFCRELPDLFVGTTITSNSAFYPSLMTKIPAIQDTEGIFTFDLTWKEIQSLTPNTYSPFVDNYNLVRNPAQANVGKYMNLTTFLEFAKSQANISVLINIQNARAIASARKIDVMNATISALNMAGYDNISDRIRIQSDDSAVLVQFKQKTKFKLVYRVEGYGFNIPETVIKEIKEFADTVALTRAVVLPTSPQFLLGTTDVVSRMHLHNISVFIYNLKNEYPALAFDFLADPTMEINTFVQVAKVDGIITDFPATARAYLGNACLHPRSPDDSSMFLVVPGQVTQIISPEIPLAPAPAPYPNLSPVVEPPLPSVIAAPPTDVAPSPAPPSKPNNARSTGQPLFSSLLIAFSILLFSSF